MNEPGDIASLILRIVRGESGECLEAIGDFVRAELGTLGYPDREGLALDLELTKTNSGLAVRIGAWSTVSIDRADVLACITQQRTVLSLIMERGLGEELPYTRSVEDVSRQRIAIQTGSPRIAFVSDEPSVPVAESRLRRAVTQRGAAALVGASSSGKTVTLASLSSAYEREGAPTLWVDLSNPTVGPAGLLAALVHLAQPDGCSTSPLVVLDDLQSAPRVGRLLLKMWTTLQPRAHLLVGCWPDALDVLDGYLTVDQRIPCDGLQTCRRLVAEVQAGTDVREKLLNLSAGDALVAELSVDYYADSGRIPSTDELATRAYDVSCSGHQLQDSEHDCLFDISCLGMFEIDARVDILGPNSRAAVDNLLEKRILRRNGEYVHFGHRSLARLVTRHYQGREPYAERSVIRFVVQYLQRAGERQIRQTLDRLDLMAVADDDDQFGAAFLAQCWSSVRALVRHLSLQVGIDPSWGDNVASAVFAGEAFAELGMEEDWQATAGYIRNRWLVGESETLPRPSTPDTAESDDFREIQRKMGEEDGLAGVTMVQAASTIDVDRFHRNWVLGLLLGFEGKALDVDMDRLGKLREMAEHAQLPDGSFYPSRVPWVTARVLIGLSRCGDSVSSSPILLNAAAWLRSRPPLGPCSFGVWRPGTGTWNTDIQMTAMALLALGSIGLGTSDRSVRTGLEFLKAGRNEWYRPGKEIDCAQAIEAALVLGASWRDFGPEIGSLLAWAQDSRSWNDTRTLASIKQDESSKVPLVASALIAIVWETVRAELPLLLQSIIGDEAEQNSRPAEFDTWNVVAGAKIDRLETAVLENVRDRESVVSRGRASGEVRQALVDWKAKQRRVEACKASLRSLVDMWDAGEAVALVAELNDLGSMLLGDAWEQICPPV